MLFEQLPRYPQRQEQEELDPEIWQPSWHCFCCHDSGIVLEYLVKMVIPDYNDFLDKFPRCNRPGCNSGSHLTSDALIDSTDDRLSAAICKKLDEFERQQERQAMSDYAHNLRQRAAQLTKNMSIRSSDRTLEENREVQRRKEEIENITQEDWRQMIRKYEGATTFLDKTGHPCTTQI